MERFAKYVPSRVVSKEDSCLASFTKLVLAVASSIGVMLWLAFVVTVLWRWFVVPLGVPPLALHNAIGLGLIVSMLRPGSWFTADREMKYPALTRHIAGYLIPALTLGVGWAVHRWI